VRRAALALICSAALATVPAASAAAETSASASAPVAVDLGDGTGIRSVAAAVDPSAVRPTIRVIVDEVARADGAHWWVMATVAGTTSTIVDGWGRNDVLSTRQWTAARTIDPAAGTVVLTLFQ
jgi:hypothetical protein